MGSRVENTCIRSLLRVSHASLDASLAAVVGHQGACATSSRRRGSGGGKTWVGVLFRHEGLKTGTLVSNGNK